MRTASQTGVGLAALGVMMLVFLELVALGAAPARDRPMVAGTLIGAAAAAFVVIMALVSTRQATARRSPLLPDETDLKWPDSLAAEGFPMDAVRSLLLSPGAPSLNRLYVAWGFANRGYGAAWMERYLDLPAAAAWVLADAAFQRG